MNFYTTTILPLLILIEPGDRKKALGIVALMILNAFLDFFSLASFLPLIFLVINPDFISSNIYANKFYHFAGFNSSVSFIVALTTGVLLFVLIKNLISIWIAKVKARYAFGLGSSLSSRTFTHFMEMSYLNISKVDFTRELNRLANYPLAFANNIVLPIASLISEGFVSLLILTGIAFSDYKITILIFIILLPAFFLYHLRKESLKEINHDLKEKYPLLMKYALQVVEGFSEIKVYGKENFFRERFQRMNEKVTQIFIKDQTIQSGTVRLTEIVIGFVICFLIIYSVSMQQHYQQTLLLLGIYAGASFRVIPSVNRILHALQQIKMHQHLFEELGSRVSVRSIHRETSPHSMAFDETVELKNISFTYPEREPLLQNASIVIRKGEKVGLTGKSGEGKTTLLLILLRFLKETEGEICVDGSPILDENAWRKLVGYVPQNPYTLDGTVAENIAFGIPTGEIDRTKILQLINDLDLNELIKQLPGGIDTRIGERGAKLSGGQRQRLALARALYLDREILLFDEITNELHASLELEILNVLNRFVAKGKTIIIVTHKLPHVDFFDSIYRLENGNLHEVAMPS